MAAEYNLIPAAEYDKLMKVQKKLDTENNASKKHLTVDEKETLGEDKDNTPRKHDKDNTDGANDANDNDTDPDEHPMDIDTDIHHNVDIKKNGDKKRRKKVNDNVDNDMGKNGNLKPKHKRKHATPVKFENIPTEDVEAIVGQFNDLLKKKVKRLITYIFKFGRDIKLDKGILYYKTDGIGDVVKLIKSLFGVIPPMKGLRKLRKVLFILSVPSDLYILSTSERKKMGENYTFDKEANPFKIDWLKY